MIFIDNRDTVSETTAIFVRNSSLLACIHAKMVATLASAKLERSKLCTSLHNLGKSVPLTLDCLLSVHLDEKGKKKILESQSYKMSIFFSVCVIFIWINKRKVIPYDKASLLFWEALDSCSLLLHGCEELTSLQWKKETLEKWVCLQSMLAIQKALFRCLGGSKVLFRHTHNLFKLSISCTVRFAKLSRGLPPVGEYV